MHTISGDGPPNARVMLVGEAWGSMEERVGLPFMGASGEELNRMLRDAGLMRSECYTTNLVNARPPNNDIEAWLVVRKKDIKATMRQLRNRWAEPVVWEGFHSLLREIALVQPNVVACLGNAAMWALTGKTGILKWRGSQLTIDVPPELFPPDLDPAAVNGKKLIPCLHPAYILRDWSMRATTVFDLRRVARERQIPAYGNIPRWEFQLARHLAETLGTLEWLRGRLDVGTLEWIDFDIETAAGHIDCVGLSWSLTEALVIPFMARGCPQGYWDSVEDEAAIVWALYQVLCHPKVKVRWQNGLYDAQYTYRHWHFVPRGAQDTMISQHSAFCLQPKSLAFQASLYCDHYIYWKDDGKVADPKVPEEKRWIYNGTDCVRTRECGESLAATIEALGLGEVEAFQQEFFWPVLQCMQRGVAVSQKKRAEFRAELETGILEREEWLRFVLGRDINTASSTQMIELFYDVLQQPKIFSRATKGSPSHLTCNYEALQTIAQREPLLRPLIQKIDEIRSLNVFLNTFIKAPLDVDGRMRTSYNICGTGTYRFSSSKNAFGSGTNLQNVPAGDEASEDDEFAGLVLPNVRKIFVPDQGFEMFDKDLSKADLRIVTWEADEPEMKAMLREGKDPYVEIAREFYHDPALKKTRDDGTTNPLYRTFKAFAHGTHYLGTPQGLAARLGLTVHEAERSQRWYLGKMKRIAAWQRDFQAQFASRGYVENIFGYRRYTFDRIDAAACRAAIAWVPQSTVALYINRIWMNLYKQAPYIQVLLQVHDSLVGQYPCHLRARAVEDLEKASQIVLPYDDPLVIPTGTKVSTVSWGDCK